MSSSSANTDYEDQSPARRSARSRRLQRHLRRREECELNIVSMIDVFAVIVFFLLFGSSVSASRLHALKLDIPAAPPSSDEAPQEKPLQLTVSLRSDKLSLSDKNGLIASFTHSDGKPDTPALTAKLLEIKSRLPEEKRLTLLVENDIPYEQIVAVMDAARDNPSQADAELFPLIAIGDALSEGEQ